MADQYGYAITFASPPSVDHREILAAEYAFFAADLDPNWSIKAGVTVPTMIATPGDTGYVLEDKATGLINIARADHNGCGGVLTDGTAISTADDMLIGIDPSGGITDITVAGFTVGSRWSGWAPNAEGAASTSQAGRAKISSGADWLFIRNKKTVTGEYDGGSFAGACPLYSAGGGDGFCVGSGLWSDWAASSANEHLYFEVFEGVWEPVRVAPGDAYGPIGSYASDGSGNFTTCPVVVAAVPSSYTVYLERWAALGAIPALFSSADGTPGKVWKNSGGDVIGYNLTGGSWIAKDDGTYAE